MAYSALGLIWRKGYGGVSNLVRWRGGGLLLGGGCRSFSSVESVGSGRMSPWLMLPPASEGGETVYKFFSLAENRVLSFNWSDGAENCSDFDRNAKLVGSSKGWVGLMNNRTRQMDLINPLTRRRVKLPSLEPLGRYSATKIILSCSPDEEKEEGECRALITYGDKENRDYLMAFCFPGRSDAEWTPICDQLCYESFVYSRRQKLFYCAGHHTELQAWDLRDPLSPKLMTETDLPIEEGDCPPALLGSDEDIHDLWEFFFLVANEDTDDVFVVRQFVKHDEGRDPEFKTITLDVHRYDRESGTLRYMERGGGSLDGLSFFIGTNMNGFALSAKEFPELKPNSIYFVFDDFFGGRHNMIKVGIFSYEDATVSPLCGVHVPSFNKPLSPVPMWFTPNTSSN